VHTGHAERYWDESAFGRRQLFYIWVWLIGFFPVGVLLLFEKPEGRWRTRWVSAEDEAREQARQEQAEAERAEWAKTHCATCHLHEPDHEKWCAECVHEPEVVRCRGAEWLLSGGAYVPGRTYFYVWCSCGLETAAHDTPGVSVTMYEDLHGYRVKHGPVVAAV
jgi:hypothetical protein